MTPTRQTVFVATSPKGRGDCMGACLASLLDLPLDEVLDTTADVVRDDWYGEIGAFLAARGLKLLIVKPDDPLLEGRYSIGCGPSPRGAFRHAVVCKSGRMVFDPHPSDDGVKWFSRHELLDPLTEEEAQTWAESAAVPKPDLRLYA